MRLAMIVGDQWFDLWMDCLQRESRLRTLALHGAVTKFGQLLDRDQRQVIVVLNYQYTFPAYDGCESCTVSVRSC